MASCSLGATSIKLSKLDFCVAGVGTQQRANGARQLKVRRQFQYVGLALSNKPKKAFAICCDPSLEAEATANRVEEFKETKSSGLTSQLIPNSSEIESLVSEICNTTSIVEFELKLNGFRLYVTRNIPEKSEPPPQPASAHAPPPALVGANAAAGASDLNGSVLTTALVVSKPVPSSEGIQSFLNRASDEGLMILQSPRVGFFRRSRTIKGKRAPPSCKEKQIVKEGQVLCYIEQLGGELPIESDVSGEVIKILRDDGEPVGYGDALIAILPSFPGIKKLQ